jgi:dGTPase
VRDIVEHSETSTAPGTIALSDEIRRAADCLREFLFERVYTPLNERPDTRRAQGVVRELFAYFASDVERIPAEYRPVDRADPARLAADFVSSMTDRYAVETFQAIFVPRFWSNS